MSSVNTARAALARISSSVVCHTLLHARLDNASYPAIHHTSQNTILKKTKGQMIISKSAFAGLSPRSRSSRDKSFDLINYEFFASMASTRHCRIIVGTAGEPHCRLAAGAVGEPHCRLVASAVGERLCRPFALAAGEPHLSISKQPCLA